MKIINRSNLLVDEDLWRQISEVLGLEERRYQRWRGKAAELNVIVDVQKSRNGECNAHFGRHKPSKTMIFPCCDCTEGTVLFTFLHEIMHEWIFWYQPELYSKNWTEDLCEGAARHIFHLLGGELSAEENCSRYKIDQPVGSLQNHTTVLHVLTGFGEMSPDQLRAFGLHHTAN